MKSSSPANGRNAPLLALKVLLLVALAAAFLLIPEPLKALIRYDALHEEAGEVVDAYTSRTLTSFLAVSTAKAGLAIIEGSSVGIGVQIQLGDAVQSAYDYIDFVWKMLLTALLLLGIYKVLLETGLLSVGFTIVAAGLLLWAGGLIFERYNPRIRQGGQRIVMAGFMIAYLLPIGLLAMHYGASHYTGKLRLQHEANLMAVSVEVDTFKSEFSALRADISILSPMDSFDAVRSRIATMAASLSNMMRDSAASMLYYGLIVLFELFVFPLLSAFVLYKLAQYFLVRGLEAPYRPGPEAVARPAEA